MSQKQIERKSLIVSSVVNFMIAGAGIWVYSATQIQALFVDGFFSVIAFASSIIAVVISKVSQKRTHRYPDGLHFLEPLYAILKSMLTLVLLVMAVVNASGVAYEYFAHGTGSPMNIGPVLPYAACMVVLCIGLGVYNTYQNRKINNTSIILTAESKSNIIDGLQSLGIGIAIALLYLVDINGPLGFLHYTGDFFVTVLLALISVKEPVKVLAASFMELSGATVKSKEIAEAIGEVIKTQLGNTSEQVKWEIFKTGMHFKVHISPCGKANEALLSQLVAARQKIIGELSRAYESVEIAIVI